jgi:hypothetical protein
MPSASSQSRIDFSVWLTTDGESPDSAGREPAGFRAGPCNARPSREPAIPRGTAPYVRVQPGIQRRGIAVKKGHQAKGTTLEHKETERSCGTAHRDGIHLSLHGKGGVGKSLVPSILAQNLRGRGRSIQCIDTDPVKPNIRAIRRHRRDPPRTDAGREYRRSGLRQSDGAPSNRGWDVRY